MIYIKHRVRTASDFVDEPVVIERFSGLTIAELAPEGATGCVYKDEVLNTSSDEWNSVVVDDETSIAYFTAPEGIELAIAAIGYIVYAASLAVTNAIVGLIGYGLIKGLQYGITALLPGVPTPDGPSSEGGQSTNYGFRLTNVIGNNVPIIVLYGESRVAGSVSQYFSRYNSEGNEVLYYCLVLSEGEIEAIGDYTSDQDSLSGEDLPDTLRFDDLDAKDLEGVEVSLRMGSLSQTVMPGFEEQIIQYSQSFVLDSGKYFVWLTKDPCHAVEINFFFEAGLRKIDLTTGETASGSVAFDIEVYDETGTLLISEESQRYRNAKSTAFGFTKRIDFPEYGRYLVRIRKTTPDSYKTENNKFDKMSVGAMSEVKTFGIAHRGRALAGIVVEASDQLSGGFPNTSVICKGRKVYNPVADVTEYTRNNAWCMRDWMLNKKYGLGNKVDASDLDADAFEEWAEYCDELIDPWTGAEAVSGLVRNTDNEGSISPEVSGAWTPLDSWGEWKAEIIAYSVGVSLEIEWTYTPDYETGDPEETFTTTHTDADPETIAYGLEAVANPGQAWSVGDSWTFRVLKEPRCRLDLLIDKFGSAYELAQNIARAGRAVMFVVGSQYTIDIQNQKSIEGGVFALNANVKRDSVNLATESPLSRYNVIEVEFVSRDLDYEQDNVSIETVGISDGVYEEQKQTVRLIGITRRTEANRFADFYRRIQSYQRDSIKFTGGIDAVTMFPGQVFKFNDVERESVISGRIASYVASTSVTLDAPDGIDLEEGEVYTYTERQADGTVSVRDFVVPSTANYTTIPVAPFDTDPTGNPYIIGRKTTDSQLYVCASISAIEDVTEREILGVLYTDDIFSDDAPPVATSFVAPELGDPPANVTDLALVETVSGGQSQIDLSWTASAGTPAALRYKVYYKAYDSDYVLVGETAGTTFTDLVRLPTGTAITYAVQPISETGAVNPLTSVSTISYAIRRFGSVIIDYPDDVPSASVGSISGTDATLSWGSVAGVDGYEVRIGGWHDSVLIYRGTSTSCPIKLNNLAQRYHIRAYNVIGGTPFYSPDDLIQFSPTANFSTFSTEVLSASVDFENTGVIQNGTSIEFLEYESGNALIQTIPYYETRYTSETIDLGSGADTHISTDIRWVPYQIGDYGDLSLIMLHRSFYGEFNKDYLDVETFIQYSTSGNQFLTARLDTNLDQDIVLDARYFKFVVRVKARRQSETPEYPCAGLFTKLEYSFYR